MFFVFLLPVVFSKQQCVLQERKRLVSVLGICVNPFGIFGDPLIFIEVQGPVPPELGRFRRFSGFVRLPKDYRCLPMISEITCI